MEDSYKRLLEAAKELKGIESPAAVARLLRISDQTIQNWKTRGVPDSKLVEIEEKIEALPTWIKTGQGAMSARLALEQTKTLEGALTREQQQMILLMGSMDKEARDALLKMGGVLAKRLPERRKDDVGRDPERRRIPMPGAEYSPKSSPTTEAKRKERND